MPWSAFSAPILCVFDPAIAPNNFPLTTQAPVFSFLEREEDATSVAAAAAAFFGRMYELLAEVC